MNRLKLSLLGAAAAIPAASLLFASAAGPNLLQNGDFSNGVAGWNNSGGNPQAVNGAMQLTNGYQGTGNSYYSALQCVTGIQEGINYTAKGDAYIELGQTSFGAAGIYLHFYTGDNCDGTPLGGGHTSNGFNDAQRGYWLPLTHSVNAPVGAKSVWVRPTALKEPQPGGTSDPSIFIVLFDNLEFFETNGPVEPTPDPDPQPDPVEDPTPEPEEDPAPDPAEDPAPEPEGDPTPDPQEDPTPEPEEEPVPGGDEPQDEPSDEPTTEDVPEVPEVPQVPEVPEVPETPVPASPDPEPTPAPQPQTPAGDPAPEQPTTPAQPAPEQKDAPAPAASTPLPPATGNGPAMTGPSALGTIVFAIGASLAGLGSAAAAATIRRR